MQMLFDPRLLRARTLRIGAGRRVHVVLHRVRGRMQRAAFVTPAVQDPPRAASAPHVPHAARPAAAPVEDAVVVSSTTRTWRTALEDAISRFGRRISRLWQRLAEARRARHRPATPRP